MAQGDVWTCLEYDAVAASCTVEGYAPLPASPVLWPYTMEESADIAFAIGLLWAMCWGFRQVARALNT